MVVRPLVSAVENAHADVNALLTQYNQQLQLPPLPDVIGSENTVDIELMLRYGQVRWSHTFCPDAAPRAGALWLNMSAFLVWTWR